ncbi:MAG: hypothetical protein ACP5KJ_02975 [Candidatus Micrarchaeia archaeon]
MIEKKIGKIEKERFNSGVKFSKFILPLFESIYDYKAVMPARIIPVPMNINEYNVDIALKSGIPASILFGKSKEDDCIVPKYVMMNNQTEMFSSEVIAVMADKRLLISLESNPAQIYFDGKESILKASRNVTTVDMFVNGRHAVRMFPIVSSFVILHVFGEGVKKKRYCDIKLVQFYGKWKGTVKDLLGEELTTKIYKIKPSRKEFAIVLMKNNNNDALLFVNGNNLENLTDISPVFLLLDIRKKYVMVLGKTEYYGAYVTKGGLEKITNFLKSSNNKF